LRYFKTQRKEREKRSRASTFFKKLRIVLVFSVLLPTYLSQKKKKTTYHPCHILSKSLHTKPNSRERREREIGGRPNWNQRGHG
jgi:hypothetical protein